MFIIHDKKIFLGLDLKTIEKSFQFLSVGVTSRIFLPKQANSLFY